MPEQDKEARDMQTRCRREAVDQGLYDPQLHRPEQVSILEDLVGEEASLSTVRGGARRSTLQVQDPPRQRLYFSQDSHLLVIVMFCE